jgi:hypothetical protein
MFFKAGLDRANQLETIAENCAFARSKRERTERFGAGLAQESQKLAFGFLRQSLPAFEYGHGR